MPIYEFYCPDNHTIYSYLARSLRYSGLTPRCPDNPKFRMERMISNFSFTGRAKGKTEASDGSPTDDPRMEAAMAEMEREFGGMDSENPDPRQLARMMRKMSALAGNDVPAPMEEMMRRMEAGENPEKLEEEFGDVMGEFDPGGGAENEVGDVPGSKARRRLSRHHPVRDPVLYEMSEYVE